MPDFKLDDWDYEDAPPKDSDDFQKYMQAQKRAAIKAEEEAVLQKPFVPQCHVCTHPFRDLIDSMLMKADISYSELGRRMPPGKNGRQLDHRQISTHAKKHLGAGEAAIRAILEEEAERSNREFAEGVRGAITHRGGLEVAFRRAFEDIINGTASVEPKDMIKIAEIMRKWDAETEQVQADFLRAQVTAIEAAIKKVVPRHMWEDIAKEARREMEKDGLVKPLPSVEPKQVENQVESD